MTTSQETMTDAARRGQEAITSALQIWADSFQKFMPASDIRLRGAVEVVDNMFDFAEQMLLTQREFTKTMLAAGTSAATKAAYVAKDAARDMEYAGKDVRDGAKDMKDGVTDRRTGAAKDVDATARKS